MTIKTFFSIVELRTKIVSVSTFFLFHLWLWATYGHLDGFLLVLSFLAVLAVDMGTTAFNTYYDYKNQVDDSVYNREPDKVLVHQGVVPFYALAVAWSLFFLAGLLGILLILFSSPWLLPLGLLSLLVGFFYSGGPRPLAFTPFGEWFAGFFLGSVLWMVLWIIQGSPGNAVSSFLVSLPSACLIAAILAVNNLCDRIGDQKAGRKTFVIVFGPRIGVVYLTLWVVLGYLIGILGGVLGFFPMNTLVLFTLGGAFSVLVLTKMHQIGYDHGVKGVQMNKISRIFLAFTGFEALSWFFFKFFLW